MDRDKMSNLYKGPSIDSSYQVSVHLEEGFQGRRLKYEKVNGWTTDNGNTSHGPNLAVSIYVRSSIKFLHFVPFHQQIWLPRAILVSAWLLFKKIF
jgi:hypothetical protein